MPAEEISSDSTNRSSDTRAPRVLFKQIALVVILAVVGIVGWKVYHLNLYSDLIQRANVAVNAGDYENAIALIRQAQRIDRSDPTIQRTLAKSLLATKQWKKALEAFSAIDPPTSDDLEQLAMLAANQRDWEASAKAWISLRGMSAQAESLLIQYLTNLQQSNKIAEIADLCSQISEQSKDQSSAGFVISEMTLAVMNQERGFHSRALSHWDNSFKISSQTRIDSEARRNERLFRQIPFQYAASLLRSGRHHLALEILNSATSENNIESIWLKSRAFLQAGDAESAKKAILAYQQIGAVAKPEQYRFAEPSQYVGASKCQPCHAEQFKSQSSTHHAESFGLADLASMSDYWPNDALNDPEYQSVAHSFRPEQSGLSPQVIVHGEQDTTVSLSFRLGSGTRGQSFIAETDHPELHTVEYRMSIYPSHGWDLTTGQDKGPAMSQTSTATIGRALHWTEQFSCLRCHNSDPETALEATTSTPHDQLSIRCEACHGPGGNHIMAVELRLHELDLALTQPKKFTARESVRLCASCHQPDQFDDNRDPTEATSARFQTIGLQASKCFKQSETLSCITCHSPHLPLVRDNDMFYNRKCIECHQDQSKLRCPTESLADGNRSGSCIDCHMPEVQGAMRHTTFADHYIRIPAR